MDNTSIFFLGMSAGVVFTLVMILILLIIVGVCV